MPSESKSMRQTPRSMRKSWLRMAASRVLSRSLRQHECLFCLAALREAPVSGNQLTGAYAGACCSACEAELPRPSPHACRQCAASIEAPGLCGECIARPPAFDAAVAACVYAFPVSQLISQFKYGSRLALAGWMVEALVAAVRARGNVEVDWILPLPLSRERITERGFNQAALIAAGVARQLSLPLHRDELLRVRNTAPQASLDHEARWGNVRGAFAVDAAASAAGIAGQRIALIDDVMTTGATMDAAASALKKAGAARVEAWVVARAERRSAAATQGEAIQDV